VRHLSRVKDVVVIKGGVDGGEGNNEVPCADV